MADSPFYITADQFQRAVGMDPNAQKRYIDGLRKADAERRLFSDGFYTGDGARIVLSREPGLTAKGLLTDALRFQVPPQDDVTVQHSFSHTDYETLGGQQLSQPGSHGLSTVSLSGMMLLDFDASYGVYHYGGTRGQRGPIYLNADAASTPGTESREARADATPPSPLHVAKQLVKLMESGTPFRLNIGQAHIWNVEDFSRPVTLRSVSVSERSGEPDTRYTDLAFTEFRRPSLLGRKGQAPDFHKDVPSWMTVYQDGHVLSEEGRRIGTEDVPATLSMLSQVYYGTGSKWRSIIQHPNNREWRSATPNTPLRVYAKKSKGTDRLYIPRLPKSGTLTATLTGRVSSSLGKG